MVRGRAVVVSAPHGSERSWFFVSSGLHGLQTFVTPLPGKCSCHEITNLPVARKKKSRRLKRMNKREKNFTE